MLEEYVEQIKIHKKHGINLVDKLSVALTLESAAYRIMALEARVKSLSSRVEVDE